MASGFSEQAKNEIAAVKLHSRRGMIAFLSAIIHTAGSLMISDKKIGFMIFTENVQIPLLTDEIVYNLYKAKGERLSGSEKSRRVEIKFAGSYAEKCLTECGILSENREVFAGIAPKLLEDNTAKCAYIRGAFLGAGSVSPNRYHLEFALSSPILADDLMRLLLDFHLAPRKGVRKEKRIVYLKESQAISDLLALMGANRAVLALNNQIAQRQIGGYVNRTTNCEIHNLDKQVNAFVLQQQAIRYLTKHGLLQDEKLFKTASARLNNPEASYDELADALGISKSGVKHRLAKIVELYTQNEGNGGEAK